MYASAQHLARASIGAGALMAIGMSVASGTPAVSQERRRDVGRRMQTERDVCRSRSSE